jgi:hypothetical protein
MSRGRISKFGFHVNLEYSIWLLDLDGRESKREIEREQESERDRARERERQRQRHRHRGLHGKLQSLGR